jgi:hypothetical protein
MIATLGPVRPTRRSERQASTLCRWLWHAGRTRMIGAPAGARRPMGCEHAIRRCRSKTIGRTARRDVYGQHAPRLFREQFYPRGPDGPGVMPNDPVPGAWGQRIRRHIAPGRSIRSARPMIRASDAVAGVFAAFGRMIHRPAARAGRAFAGGSERCAELTLNVRVSGRATARPAKSGARNHDQRRLGGPANQRA